MSHCKLRRNAANLGCGPPDKPTNPALSSENNKKFEAMMAERARQDAMLFGGGGGATVPTTQLSQQTSLNNFQFKK